MAVIKSNETLAPFFGERLSFVRGLDPLGVQNTSEATFSLLLPGLNNVTGRIRYYSFYCWLLDAYSKINGDTNRQVQRQFIRRAEYIIALLSQYFEGDKGSIPGSNYAANDVNSNENGIFDLHAGTYKPDGTTRDTYWNYSSGAFGQYYLGSLRDIGLISERESGSGVFFRTENETNEYISGEKLANAFDSNISKENKNTLLDCISKGIITEKKLKSLLPDFNLTSIPKDTDEQDLLISLLLQKDYPIQIEEEPNTFRKQTLKHLLNFSVKKPENFYDRSFVYNCYDIKGIDGSENNECLTGWYYYQLNEFWQFSCTSILNGTLSYLEDSVGAGWMQLPKLVNEITGMVVSEFVQNKVIQSSDSTIKELLENLNSDKTEYDYFYSASENEKISKIYNSLLLIFSLYINQSNSFPKLKQFALNQNIEKDGNVIDYFMSFQKIQDKTIYKFVYDFIFVHIIYRHQYVAFRKIGNGSLSTQKFIIEDYHIRYLNNFDAGYTGPRLGRLISFLKDLNVLTKENKLTLKGKKIIEEVGEL